VNAATKSALSKNEVKKHTACRDQLILEHLPLVTAVAGHVQRSLPVHVELNDLVHAGIMGLVDAATKYQGNRKVAFPTYAKYRIRGAILDSLRQLDWASRDLRKRQKQMETVTQDLTAKLQRTPTQGELAAEMGLSARSWRNLMVDFRNLGFAATQLRTHDREDHPMNDPPCAPGHSPEEVFARSESRAKLNSVRETLPERYQQVVTLYYDRDLSMKEIGGILGVNESRVSQIHKGALQKMQSALSSSGIRSVAAF
jgi:RNA polymerase sigma factor for flagellar operon FliA